MKILHIADVHLDSPFSACDPAKSEKRRAELRESFASAMRFAREEGVSLVLIAGDLFDYGFATKKTADMLAALFSEMPEIKIVISPGNHDAYIKGGVYKSVSFPENVFIFENEELSRFEFPELGADVYGYAFTSERLETSPLAGKRACDNGRLKLLCIHCDTRSPISRYAPVSREDIAAFGADYAALGHVHNPGEPEYAGECLAAYSGCLFGRSFDETGKKGAILVEYDPETKKISAEKKILAKGHYEIEELDVTGAESDREVAAKIGELVKERGYGEDTALRVILSGAVTPSYIPVTDTMEKEDFGLFSLEVKDGTDPVYAADSLEGDMTLRGEVWRILKEKMNSGSQEERETAKRALRYALAALDGRDPSDR